jgi:SSS family solute:Na+ symporter
MFGVSYMTDPPKYEKISGLTYGTLTDEDKRMSRESWNWVDVSLSVLLVVVIGFIYIYFSG